jgi:hypothetical protein
MSPKWSLPDNINKTPNNKATPIGPERSGLERVS